jgi:hypothetical protein
MPDFRRLGRGTKPNNIDGALPNLPNTGLFVQALIKTHHLKDSYLQNRVVIIALKMPRSISNNFNTESKSNVGNVRLTEGNSNLKEAKSCKNEDMTSIG